MKTININNNVLVAITKEGFDHLKETVTEDYVKHCILHYETVIDGKTYYKLQLHNVISLFGEKIYMGNNKLPIETNMLIED